MDPGEIPIPQAFSLRIARKPALLRDSWVTASFQGRRAAACAGRSSGPIGRRKTARHHLAHMKNATAKPRPLPDSLRISDTWFSPHKSSPESPDVGDIFTRPY